MQAKPTMTRQTLYRLIDALPDGELQAAARYLEFLRLAPDTIELEDAEETLTPGDLEALRLADQEIARGDTLTHAEVLARFGLEPDQL